jgi:hypothetical protein
VADNVTVNAGSGIPVRTIARTSDSQNRQVVALDIGGSSDASTEVIVTAGQQLSSGSIPVIQNIVSGTITLTTVGSTANAFPGGYPGLGFQITSVGQGCVLSAQGASDTANFFPIIIYPIVNGVEQAPVTTINSTGQYYIATQGLREVQLVCTSIVGGTVSGAFWGSQQPRAVGLLGGPGQEKSASSWPVVVASDQTVSVTDAGVAGATTSDAPLFTAVSGDPNGDFAGVNILEELCDDAGDLKLGVNIRGGLLVDANNAIRLSDSIVYSIPLPAAGSVAYVDLTGYGSIVVHNVGGTLGVTQSIDGVNFFTTTDGTTTSGALSSGALATGACVHFPVYGKTLRLTATTATVATVMLKQAQAPYACTNLSGINGAAIVTAGLNGVLSVGGNVAVGSAPTTNPISLAWDGTNTRRILTDATAGGVVLGSSAQGNGQTLGAIRATSTTPAATQIKASAGRLTALTLGNAATVAGYLHLYNATSVTLGTTADVLVYPVPAQIGNWTINLPDGGLAFSTGIGAAFTGAPAATDNTALGASPSLIASYAFI